MPLVPGITIHVIRDIYTADYLSGTIHLLDALITAICIAVGACLPFVIKWNYFEDSKLCGIYYRIYYRIYHSILMVAGFATFFFAVLFRTKKEELLYCGFSGAFEWISTTFSPAGGWRSCPILIVPSALYDWHELQSSAPLLLPLILTGIFLFALELNLLHCLLSIYQ